MQQAAVRVILHSVAYAPFSIVTLFLWMGMAESNLDGMALARAIERAAPDRIFPVWLAGSGFWIPTMLGIYRYVPLNSRTVVTSACNVLWSIYLSMKATAPR